MAQDIRFIATRHIVRVVHYVNGVDPYASQASRVKIRFSEMVNMIIQLYPDAADRQDAMARAEAWRDAQLCSLYPEDALGDVENPVVIETIDSVQPFVVVDFDFFHFRSSSRYHDEHRRHVDTFRERGPSPRQLDRSRQQEQIHLWQGSRSTQSVPVTGDNNRRDRSPQTTSPYARRERTTPTTRNTPANTNTPRRGTTGTHEWQRRENGHTHH